MAGNEQIIGTSGPMSTSFKGLEIFMKTLIEQEPWQIEPWLTPLPWLSQPLTFTATRRLRVAVMWDDGVVTPHPPVQRALQETVGRLKASGTVDVVDWHPWKHDYAWDLTVSPAAALPALL